MRRNVLPKLIEICMETPSGWAPAWRPEPTETSVTEFFLQKGEFIPQVTQKQKKNQYFFPSA